MRKILVGFLFAAVLALGLSPPLAWAEPVEDRAIEAEPVILAEPANDIAPADQESTAIAQAEPFIMDKGGIYMPMAADKGAKHLAITDKGSRIANSIALAATGTGPPWAFAHSAPAPCKDIKAKYIFDGINHHGPSGPPCGT